MTDKMIHIRLPEELYRKFKVYCAMNDMSMVQQCTHILREFIKEQSEHVKIIKLEKNKGK